MGHLAFLQTPPRLATFIELAYMTSMAQVAVVALALGFSGSLDRLRLFIVLFAFTGTATIVVSGVWPTLGAYAFHDVQDWQLPPFLNPRVGWEQTPHILALREGTMREFPLGDVRGLGSMLAIEFVSDLDARTPAPEIARAVTDAAFERGLLLIGCGIYGNCIRVLVPLVVTDSELDEALGVWEDALASVLD